jgi:hypothetical protein
MKARTHFVPRLRTAALALSLLASFAVAASAEPTHGPLRVDPDRPNGFIDATGQPIWLMGLAGCCPGPEVSAWPFLDPQIILELAAHGGNWIHIRVGPYIDHTNPWFAAYPLFPNGTYNVLPSSPGFQWNPDFLQGLAETIAYAQGVGVYVEIDLIDAWALKQPVGSPDGTPWRSDANGSGVDAGSCAVLQGPIQPVHREWLSAMVRESGYADNVIYQVGNETGVCPGGVSVAWEQSVVDFVRSELDRLNYPDHLISTNSQRASIESLPGIDYVNWHQETAASIRAGKPTAVNEFADAHFVDGNGNFEQDEFAATVWDAFTRGTMFHFWWGAVAPGQLPLAYEVIENFSRTLNEADFGNFQATPLAPGLVGRPGLDWLGFKRNGGSFQLDVGSSTEPYRFEWTDPASGTVLDAGTFSGPGAHLLASPTSGVAVLHAVRADYVPPPPPPPPPGGGEGPYDLHAWADGDFAQLHWRNDPADHPAQQRVLQVFEDGHTLRVATYYEVRDSGAIHVGYPPNPNGVRNVCYKIRNWYGSDDFTDSNVSCADVYGSAPGKPQLIAPRGCVSPLRPTFSWHDVPRATSYYFALGRIGENGYFVNGPEGVTAPQYRPDLDLEPGVGYRWKVKACNNFGCSPEYSDIAYFAPRCAPRADFEGDGKTDLLTRDGLTGNHEVLRLSGATQLGTLAFVPGQPSAPNWSLVATNDFNGDRKPDLVWRNIDSGNLAFWFLDGVTRIDGSTLSGIPDLHWQVVGSADLNQDNKPDLLWHDATTGHLKAWHLSGSTFAQEVALPDSTLALGWEVLAVGDLTGDYVPDLLVRNLTDGRLEWRNPFAQGPASGTLFPDRLDLGWKLVALSDLDGDGNLDLTWQRTRSNKLVAWFMNRTVRSSGTYFTPDTPSNPNVFGVGPR